MWAIVMTCILFFLTLLYYINVTLWVVNHFSNPFLLSFNNRFVWYIFIPVQSLVEAGFQELGDSWTFILTVMICAFLRFVWKTFYTISIYFYCCWIFPFKSIIKSSYQALMMVNLASARCCAEVKQKPMELLFAFLYFRIPWFMVGFKFWI